ncbi:hypothetical protein [Vreelandella nigrificans]|uniref:hypothetical protein n=1 Tax=Vreelandella nigrificans TaxID=2042704 RepID=UPI0013FE1AAA|nr:hypothetical protein [Halomonas nigrificans]
MMIFIAEHRFRCKRQRVLPLDNVSECALRCNKDGGQCKPAAVEKQVALTLA